MEKEAYRDCGIDEAGRGPVLGPMVISIVCGDPRAFKLIGVKDSKLLSPQRREELFVKIQGSACSIHTRILEPELLNRDMKRISLNEIEYAAVVDLLAYADSVVYIDSFDTNELRLQRRLMEDTGKKVISRHRADSTYPAVMAASIVSKVTRDRIIDDLHVEFGDFGSGYPSDQRTVAFLRHSVLTGRDISRIVRTEWSTYQKLISGRKNGGLDRYQGK